MSGEEGADQGADADPEQTVTAPPTTLAQAAAQQAQLVASAPPVAQVGIMLNLPPDAAANLAREVPVEMVKLVTKLDEHQFQVAQQRNAIHEKLAAKKAEYDHLAEMKDLDNEQAEKGLEYDDKEKQRGHLQKILGGVGVCFVLGLIFVGVTGREEFLLKVFSHLLVFAAGGIGGYGWRAIEKK